MTGTEQGCRAVATSRSARVPLVPLLAFAFALACRGADDGNASASTEDSPPWAPGEEWSLSSEPLFTIGALQGDQALGRVGRPAEGGVTFLSDGRIAVEDSQYNHILIFDQSGKLLTKFGREGEGPGEFRFLTGIQSFAGGDSLIAWGGPYEGRLSVFTADGNFVRSLPTNRFGRVNAVAGVSEDGSTLLQLMPELGKGKTPTSGVFRTPEAYRLVSSAGDSIGAFVVPGFEAIAGGGRGGGPGYISYGLDTNVALGRRFIYSGENGAFEIAVQDRTTMQTVRTLRREYAPVPIPEERLSLLKNGGSVRPHRTYPVFDRIVEDADENVWVRHGPPPVDSLRIWSVFSSGGALLGELSMSQKMSLRAVGHDVVAVQTYDEFDVTYVQIFRLIKPDLGSPTSAKP